jgi:hypothetical protein
MYLLREGFRGMKACLRLLGFANLFKVVRKVVIMYLCCFVHGGGFGSYSFFYAQDVIFAPNTQEVAFHVNSR